MLALRAASAIIQGGMKIRHIVFSLLPALAVAENATTVPDDEPMLPPLPEELLSPPQKGAEGLPATAQPVVTYTAPKDEEQTWLKLMYLKETETWPEVFRRMATASHGKDMEMCHGYALWLKGQELLYLRYDDDLSLSGIHADGHAYGVLFVEFNPYGIRVCPMQGYDLTGKNGGVCWQDSATSLWSWADAEKFWAELPKLLKADTKKKATSAQDTAVKREVATKGQRMVVFWAPAGYPLKMWWSSYARLHAAVGAQRFSLVAIDGLNLWNDVEVPVVKLPGVKTPAAPAAPAATAVAPVPAPGTAAPAAAVAPSAPTPITAAPPLHAATGQSPAGSSAPVPAADAAAPGTAPAAPATTPAKKSTASTPAVPDTLQPVSGTPEAVAPDASVRPWALEGNVAPVPTQPAKKKKTTTPAATPPTANAPQAAPPLAAAAPETAAPAAPPPAVATESPAAAAPVVAQVETAPPAPAAPQPSATGRTLDAVGTAVPLP